MLVDKAPGEHLPGRKVKNNSMKFIKSLIITAFAFAVLANASIAKAGCCDDAKAKGEACKHKCCIKAVEEKKVCEKCNPKKDK